MSIEDETGKIYKMTKVKQGEDGEYYLDINDFADFMDISKVVYYQWNQEPDGSVYISFFGEDEVHLKTLKIKGLDA